MQTPRALGFSFLTLPAFLYLMLVSLYISPAFHGNSIENTFNSFYMAKTRHEPHLQDIYEKRIKKYIEPVNLRISSDSKYPVEKSIWLGMFSVNENISLVSGTVHFSYLISNDKTTSSFTLILSSVLFAALLLVGVSSLWHNVLTYTLRFNVFPNNSYLKYAYQYFKDLGVNDNRDKKEVPMKGYMNALIAYIPGWVIGLSIGYINGDYGAYIQSPLVSMNVLIFSHLYCVCAGSLLALTINQILLFLFMRIDVDIVTRYIDDVICAIIAIFISTWVFQNGVGTTVAVTLSTLFYTIVTNNKTRTVSKEEYASTSLSAVGYANRGLSYHGKHNLEEAVRMYKKAISIYTKLGYISDCAPIYALLGGVYLDKQNLKNAEKMFLEALDIYTHRENSQEAINSINKQLNRLSELRD